MGRKRRVVRRSLIPVQVDKTVSYVDTLCIALPVGARTEAIRSLRVSLLNALRPYKARYVPKKLGRSDGYWFWALFIHQPTIAALDVLATTTTPYRIVQLHLSLDLLTNSYEEARRLHRYVESRLVPTPRPKSSSVHVREKTTYFGKGVRRGNEVVLYHDRKSKVERERFCLHIDWRLMGSTVLRKASLTTPADIVYMNHREFWDQRLRLLLSPTGSYLLAARQRQLKLKAPLKEHAADKARRLVRAALRIATGPDGNLISSDLLHFLNSKPSPVGPSAIRLFSPEPHAWMLPPELNSMWR